MKTNIYILFGVLFFLFSHYVLADADGEVYLRQYDCPSEQDALECNSSCKQYEMTSSYTADKDKKAVEVSHYKALKAFYKGKMENCNITDQNNWECNVNSVSNKTVLKMINGMYFASDVDNKSNASRFFCAKSDN